MGSPLLSEPFCSRCLRVRFGQHSAHGPEECDVGRGETVALTDHTDVEQDVQSTDLDITD